MSTKDTTTKETKAPEESALVERFIPKGYENDEPNMFIGINGVNYILPKGKTSKVPPHVAAEIDRARKAEETRDEHINELLEKAKDPQ